MASCPRSESLLCRFRFVFVPGIIMRSCKLKRVGGDAVVIVVGGGGKTSTCQVTSTSVVCDSQHVERSVLLEWQHPSPKNGG